jgi:hypothetical protein
VLSDAALSAEVLVQHPELAIAQVLDHDRRVMGELLGRLLP